jgi:hypothetical protein
MPSLSNLCRITTICILLYMGGGLALSVIQVAKTQADRTAVAICQVSQSCFND